MGSLVGALKSLIAQRCCLWYREFIWALESLIAQRCCLWYVEFGWGVGISYIKDAVFGMGSLVGALEYPVPKMPFFV